jgi:hypothetical protein
MGEMADYYLDMEDQVQEEWDYDQPEFVADIHVGNHRGYWRARDGTLIKFSVMSTSHIVNTLAFIKRVESDYKYSRVYQGLKRELKLRGQGKRFPLGGVG